MDENNLITDESLLPVLLGSLGEPDERERRDLMVMRAGRYRIGLFADETESVTDETLPTPLPFAPATVLGIVSIRGRMYTVLDPPTLLAKERNEQSLKNLSRRFTVALRGNEQLALAVERVERITEIITETIEPIAQPETLVRGIIREDAGEIIVINPQRLFEAAMKGTERRRERSL